MKKHVLGIAMIAIAAAIAATPAAPATDTSSVPIVGARLSPAERSAVVDRIVRTWGPFVQQVHGTSVAAWATRMQGTFAAANDANLQRAAGMKTFQGMMDALTGQWISDARVMDSLATQAQVLGSSPVRALLGSATSDLVYTPIAPCRIADTRVSGAGGPIASGATRGFNGFTSSNFGPQGGNPTSDCGIPKNPSALMLNVTVVNPVGGGYLTVFPFGTTQPLAASLNFATGSIVGNEIAAKMTLGSDVDDFSVFASAQTNVVIDAVGYFDAPNATALDCIQVNGTAVTVADTLAAVGNSPMPTCPATYTAVSASCSISNSQALLLDATDSFGCSAVDRLPGNGNTGTVQTTATCCRVPGR